MINSYATTSLLLGFLTSWVNGLGVDPIVSFGNGQIVKGSKMMSFSEREFLSFRGIPYGQPPLGPLRFQDPLPALPWNGTFDGSIEGPACLQFDDRLDDFRGSEDCLRLNVYTHDVSENAVKRPVIVFIHGGSWSIGSGNGETDVYAPDNYMDRDIVFVTMNYRLATLGFFSTEDSVAPGNYGLLDQQLALQWVKKNIHRFGGNPETITLVGHSSGASAAHLQLLSPRSQGLFHRLIAQSGNALCPWAHFNYVGEYSRRMGKHFKCPTNSSAEMVECLRKQDAKEIANFRRIILVTDTSPIAFGPRIDVERKDPFLPMKPEDIIKSKSFSQIPFITGVTANEAGFAIARIAASKSKMRMKEFETKPDVFLNYGLGREFDTTTSSKTLAVYHNYFPGNKTPSHDLNQMERMMSDGLFFKCAVDTIELHAQHSSAPVYSYLYNHRGLFTFPMLFSEDLPVEFGVTHGDEIFLQFAIPFLPPLLLPLDIATEETLLDLWTSFALDGVPVKNNSSVEWLPVEPNQMRFITIKDGEIELTNGDYPFKSRLSNWDPVYSTSSRSNNL